MRKRTWEDVERGLKRELDRRFGFTSAPNYGYVEEKAATQLVRPTDGPFGTHYEFEGGRRIRVIVRSGNNCFSELEP